MVYKIRIWLSSKLLHSTNYKVLIKDILVLVDRSDWKWSPCIFIYNLITLRLNYFMCFLSFRISSFDSFSCQTQSLWNLYRVYYFFQFPRKRCRYIDFRVSMSHHWNFENIKPMRSIQNLYRYFFYENEKCIFSRFHRSITQRKYS